MRLFPLAVLASGCYAQVALDGVGGINLDPDGDGLDSPAEEEIGSDPAVADTDEDGYLDGEEVTANADPLDATHHPYQGGWPIGACRTDIVETGTGEGDVPSNFEMIDKFGDTVRLYDFCDRTVLLIFAAFW